MHTDPWTGIDGLPHSRVPGADQVCDQFEAAWKAGQRPQIEDAVYGATASERAALLRELIPLDADYRRRAGEIPSALDYQARFPEFDSQGLLQVLTPRADPTATAPETPRPAVTRAPAPPPEGQRLRCPHCHNPIQLQDDRPDEVLCPACGSSFQVRDARHTTTTAGMRPLGKFQLLERVGVGAFGAVWKARDLELDRIVALKIPHAGLLAEKEELERFYREARAAAQLRHPGIVTVHEVQVLEGLPTIVADFVEGAPLRDLLHTRLLTFGESATLITEVAEALHYAHEMGLVHRDIKPANIMLDYSQSQGASSPERSVGRPLVMDFGLALRAEVEVTLTLDGQILGTPAYMSPEQAAGKGHQVDRRSDVYSLGVILYEMLAGELPFRGSKAMLLVQVLREEPRPLRKLNDKIPRDLETICHKALAKDPSRRYATAQALAEDLRRWQAGKPIQARPVGQVERLWRWSRRNPVVASLTAAVVLLLGVVAGVSTTQAVRATRAEGEARQSLAEAEEARRQAEAVSQYLVQVFRSPDPEKDGRELKVVELLDQAVARLEGEFAGSPLIKGELLTALGQTYGGLGMWAKALPLHTQARTLRQKELGPDHPVTLQSSHLVAEAHTRSGQLPEALALLEETFQRRKATLGPDDPATLHTMTELGWTYQEAAQFSEALAIGEEALRRRRATLGPDHLDTLNSLNNVAVVYARTQRVAEALPLFEEILQKRQLKLDPNHPDMLRSRNNLAMTYLQDRQWAKALPLFEEVVELRKAKLGPHHPETLSGMASLASSYVAAGRFAEGLPLLEESWQQMKIKLGPQSREFRNTTVDLAFAYRAAGRLADARALYEESLLLSTHEIPARRLNPMSNLALVYQAQGDYARAETLLLEIIALSKQLLGADSPLVARRLAYLGRNHLKQQKYNDAEPVLREAFAIYYKRGLEEWWHFDTQSLWGESLLGQNKHAEAEPLLLDGHRGLETRVDRMMVHERVHRIEALERLVQLYAAWGKPDEASAWRRKLEAAKASVPSLARP